MLFNRVVEDREHLFLESGVYGSVFVVQPSLLRVLAEDALLLCGRIPCWYLCRSTRVRWEDEGGTGDASVLLGKEDESKVAVLASVEVALDGCCVNCQELVGLLNDEAVQIVVLLGG